MSEMTSTPSDFAVVAYGALQDIIREMEFPGEITVTVSETPEQIVLTMHSEQPLGMLIGSNGQNLNALELLVRSIAQHQTASHGTAITLDAEGFRAQQVERLAELTRAAAERAMGTGEPVSMDPMTPRDRRSVHMVVAELPGITSDSAGEEPNRYVVIYPEGYEH